MRYSISSIFRVMTIIGIVALWFSLLYKNTHSSVFLGSLAVIGLPMWSVAVFRCQIFRVQECFIYFGLLYTGWLLLAVYGELGLFVFGKHEIRYVEQFDGADVIAAKLIFLILMLPAIVLASVEYRAWISLAKKW